MTMMYSVYNTQKTFDRERRVLQTCRGIDEADRQTAYKLIVDTENKYKDSGTMTGTSMFDVFGGGVLMM